MQSIFKWVGDNILLFGFIVGGVGSIINEIVKYGKSKQCSSCGKWFATKMLSSSFIRSFESTKSESYLEPTGDYKIVHRKSGSVLKAIKRTKYRSVPATVYEYSQVHSCKFCSKKNKSIVYSYTQLKTFKNN